MQNWLMRGAAGRPQLGEWRNRRHHPSTLEWLIQGHITMAVIQRLERYGHSCLLTLTQLVTRCWMLLQMQKTPASPWPYLIDHSNKTKKSLWRMIRPILGKTKRKGKTPWVLLSWRSANHGHWWKEKPISCAAETTVTTGGGKSSAQAAFIPPSPHL